MFDALIIGGGISGVTFGRLCQLRGLDNFLILEKSDLPGGLCKTKLVGNHILDTGGGHFLCSQYPEVYDFIFSHVSKSEFNYFDRISKVRLREGTIDYPIEANLWQLPEKAQQKYIDSIKNIANKPTEGLPHTFEDWVTRQLGDSIAQNYMIPYNRKIWGVDLSELDTDWLNKIPRLSPNDILRGNSERISGESKIPSHRGFYYPRTGGFQTIFDAILKPIKEKIACGVPVTSLHRKNAFWEVNGKYQSKVIINTAPWPNLSSALNLGDVLRDELHKLRTNSVIVSLWQRDYDHHWHWRYDPFPENEAHREFYIRNFAPHSAPGGVFTETNSKRWPSNGWSHGKAPLYEHFNEAAYPIPVLGHASAIKNLLSFFEPQLLFGLGRWGQWQYSNSDVCILEAMKLLNRIFP